MTIKGDEMRSRTTPTTPNRMLMPLAGLALVTALAANGIGAAQTAEPAGLDREPNFHSLKERGDIKFLPAPLQDRLVELARRPHSYPPTFVPAAHGLQRGRRAKPAIWVLLARHDWIRAERIHQYCSRHQ
jgi:hypothetical protein